MTPDVCNHCWGSGYENKPWPSHKRIEKLESELQAEREKVGGLTQRNQQPAASLGRQELEQAHTYLLRENIKLSGELGDAESTLQAIRELPDKWRDGYLFRGHLTNYNTADQCADELEALLPK